MASVALLALGFVATGGGAAGGDVWTASPAPDGSYSIETPCNSSEVAALATAPDGLKIELTPKSRVLCKKGNLLFLAGQLEVPQSAITGSLFDTVVAQGKADPTAEGMPRITTIDGKRAFLNRQEVKGRLAQTGILEISATKVIFLVAGVDESSALSLSQQGAAIDRFSSSIKVARK